MLKRFFSLIITLIIFSSGLYAQKVLTLDSCRALALHNNAAILIAKNNIMEAQEIKKQTYTNYFPKIEMTGSAFKSTDKLISIDVRDKLGFKYEGLDYGWSMGVSAELPLYAGGCIDNSYELGKLGIEINILEKACT